MSLWTKLLNVVFPGNLNHEPTIQATNMIAGRRVPENFKTSDIDAIEATTSFNKNEDSATLIKNPSSEIEKLKYKVDNILLRANSGCIVGWNLRFYQLKNLSCLLQPSVFSFRPSTGPTALN